MGPLTASAPAALPVGPQPDGPPRRPPAVVVVRTGQGWSVLAPDVPTGWVDGPTYGSHPDALSLVEAMTLADLVTAELGVTPEPDRDTRRAARVSTGSPAAEQATERAAVDPRDQEIAVLRRTVGQLEHALATRVSVERAIGVLAERHETTPREAFEDLRRRARSLGRPAHELATEVLDALSARAAVPDQRGPASSGAAGAAPVPALEPRPARGHPGRRVQRQRRADDGTVPEAQH